MIRGSGSKELFQHGCVTGILEFRIEVVLDEVEKSQQVRVAASLCLLLSPLRDLVQERKNLSRGHRGEEGLTKGGEEGFNKALFSLL